MYILGLTPSVPFRPGSCGDTAHKYVFIGRIPVIC
jgi:hypothetical protein